MARIDIISKLLLFENIFCVFRNYSLLSKKLKYLAVAWTAVELILNGVAIYHTSSYMLTSAVNMNTLFNLAFGFLPEIHGYLVILLSLKNTESFKDLCLHLDAVYNEFEDNEGFQKSLNKIKAFALFITLVYAVNLTAVITFFVWDFVKFRLLDPNANPSLENWFAFGTFRMVYSQYRYLIEFLALIMFASIVHECLKQLKDKIWRLTHVFGQLSTDITGNEVCHSQNDLNKWEVIVGHLSECRGHLEKCFGVQIAFSILIATVFFIFLMYKGVSDLKDGRPQVGKVNTIFLITNYTVMILSTLVIGQKARNEGDEVTKALARLYNTLVTSTGVTELKKSVKSLHRKIALEPIKIKIFSGVYVHMPLLLDILTVTITYTIILLQFNHIV